MPTRPDEPSAHFAPRPLAAPMVDIANAPFWKAAAEGVLLIKRCSACCAPHWYPRPHCPHCGHPDTRWEPVSGRGTVYSYTVTRRNGPVPYVLAYVSLEEGITMLTNLVWTEEADLRIGLPVRVVFERAEDGGSIPMFTTADAR